MNKPWDDGLGQPAAAAMATATAAVALHKVKREK